MANITWIIGNGFDLNIGLNTRYIDFYKEYIKNIPDNNVVIQNFKKEILRDESNGWKNWADFESGMGKQSRLYNGEKSADDFISCFRDFINCFHSYLENECLKIRWEEINNEILNIFKNSITNIINQITSVRNGIVKEITNKYSNSISLNSLQLNYTNVFDELLSRSGLNMNINFHLHGALNKNPVMGVDDMEQIENEVIRNDTRIQKIFVKQGYLSLLQNVDVNKPNPDRLAQSIISSTNIFCFFGVSIGDTDMHWWKEIGERLRNSDSLLIIFDVCGQILNNIDPVIVLEAQTVIDDRRNGIINRFLRLSGLGEDWILNNHDRIIVELDRPIFNFKLPLKEPIQ